MINLSFLGGYWMAMGSGGKETSVYTLGKIGSSFYLLLAVVNTDVYVQSPKPVTVQHL